MKLKQAHLIENIYQSDIVWCDLCYIWVKIQMRTNVINLCIKVEQADINFSVYIFTFTQKDFKFWISTDFNFCAYYFTFDFTWTKLFLILLILYATRADFPTSWVFLALWLPLQLYCWQPLRPTMWSDCAFCMTLLDREDVHDALGIDRH